mgnify:CR=1 FL=1
MPKEPNKRQLHEARVVETAKSYTTMVFRVGRIEDLPSLEAALEAADQLVNMPENVAYRPATVYAVNEKHFVLMGTYSKTKGWQGKMG